MSRRQSLASESSLRGCSPLKTGRLALSSRKKIPVHIRAASYRAMHVSWRNIMRICKVLRIPRHEEWSACAPMIEDILGYL